MRSSLAQRLGPATNNQSYNKMDNNCTLELRKIPPELNSILHLNQHFSKFGTITNIQVSCDFCPFL